MKGMDRQLLRSSRRVTDDGTVVWTMVYYNFNMEQIETFYCEDKGIQKDIEQVNGKNERKDTPFLRTE